MRRLASSQDLVRVAERYFETVTGLLVSYTRTSRRREVRNVKGSSLSLFLLDVLEIVLCTVGERDVVSTVLIELRDDCGQVIRRLLHLGHLDGEGVSAQ